MDVTTSSVATRENVSQLNEEQADEKHEVQKKLALPPEYDENDSRWTLRYRTPAEGLVELIEHSAVYVNAEKLAECERLSGNSNKLAELLLTEIFTISALSTCSWSGTNTDATDTNGGHATPQLDEHATNILMKFVKEYAQLHYWELEDCHCIVKNLRKIMLEMKQKKERETERETEISIQPRKNKKFIRNFMLGMSQKKVGETETLVQPRKRTQIYSTWGLNHRKPAEGLVELLEGSGVYVNADKLSVCKKLSNDYVTLARMLLREIFTEHALYVCLVPDIFALSTTTEQSETDNSLVLDKHAMSTLLQFTVQYGQSKNWRTEEDEQTRIQDSIRQKMEVISRSVWTPVHERHDHTRLLQYNTRCTLKYHGPAPELVELVERSGVYVNAVKLAECKEESKDSVTLAQKLLTEVFDESALRTRSLSEKNNICYGLKSQLPYMKRTQWLKSFKQELDAYAEIILLNFVDEYGLDQGFPVVDFQDIRNGMVERMREIREEYDFKQKSFKLMDPIGFMTAEENSSTSFINHLSQIFTEP